MSLLSHRRDARSTVACFVLIVSDTRSLDTDTSGRAITELLTAAGHIVTGTAIVPDDAEKVATALREAAANDDVQAVISTGGTGIGPRDSTYEAAAGLLQKELPGFGELFRALSFNEIGSAAMLSRATAGTIGSTVLFVLPGSEHAVRLAMTRLILPELTHLVGQLQPRT
jgi:molybdenum cofactor biosynthesis protein B